MTTVSAIQKLNPMESAPGKPINMVICLVMTDFLTLLISVVISLAFKLAVNGHLNFQGYFRLWPFLFVFIASRRTLDAPHQALATEVETLLAHAGALAPIPV